jgi:O-antigen ligase
MMRPVATRLLPAGDRRLGASPWAIAFGAGIAVVGLAEAVLLGRESRLGFLLLALVALAVGVLAFADHLFEVLVGWVVLEGIAFPFIRYPYGSAPYFTFDRYVLVALGLALLLQQRSRMSPRSRNLAIAIGAFVVAYGLRAVTTNQLPLPAGTQPVSSLQPIADWLDGVLLPFVVFLVAAKTVTPKRWPIVAKALTFAGVSMAVFALFEWATGFSLTSITGLDPFFDGAAGVVRHGGPYSAPTALGSVMVVCMAGTLYWLQTEKAYLLGGIALGIELLGLVPGLTKTVWGAAFVVVLIGLGVRSRVSSRTLLVALYAVTTVVVIYLFVRSSPVVAARVTSTAADDNFLGRVATWHQAVAMFGRWPVWGVGIEQFIGAQLLVPQMPVGGVLPVPSAHNTLLSVLAEGGLLATIPLIAIVYTAARVARACKKLARTHSDEVFRAVLLGALVGSVFLSMTFGEIYEPPAFTYVALLLGAAAARVDHLTRAQRANTAGGVRPRRLS